MERGRFAPTPSGLLHMGSLVAALASYLDVRKRGGEWLVRIEDVDTVRSRIEFETAILRELERHGLFWDEEVVRQSERSEHYFEALARLESSNRLYRCFCSRQRLRTLGCAQNAQGELIYPGFCRPVSSRNPVFHDSLGSHSLRFFVGDDLYAFQDIVYGQKAGKVLDEVGDFVLRRADGCFTYHLAVVVDDFLQGVTRVVRGADILSLTGRHILLQRTLGYPTPVYAHIPLVLSETGEKLSKSGSAEALSRSSPVSNLIHALAHLGIETRARDFSSVDDILFYALENYALT